MIKIAGRLCLAFILLAGCGPKSGVGDDTTEDGTPDATDGGEDAADDTDAFEAVEGLIVYSTSPAHGPFTGGQRTTVRGGGFEAGASVYFGDHMVQTADTLFVDEYKIEVLTPANAPGPVAVRVVQGDEEASKDDAYTYDTFYVDPPSGSIAGGTLVTIEGSGTTFESTSVVTFDGREATDVEFVSTTQLLCKTPQGFVGPADVEIAGTETYEVDEAYEYYNHADPVNGGLGGDPIAGTVNVTVIDSMTGNPVEDAFVILGIDGATEYQGHTNSFGQITFSGPDLTGRQTITAAKSDETPLCEEDTPPHFESTTIENFDATDVTILLQQIPCPSSGPLPPGRYGAVVAGELVFMHGGEFGPGPWEIIPDPNANEERVAYVYGTGWDIWNGPPDPTSGGTNNEVKDTEEYEGDYGYRYECFVRPDAVAVYALAGLRNVVTDEFTPYAFGIARNIIAGPGEYLNGVLIYMTHELNTPVRVRMDDPPPLVPGGYYDPDTYKVDVFIDLGGDGVIWREDRTQLNKTGSTVFTFPGWLPLDAELSDATYTVIAGAFRENVNALTGELEYVNPFSVRIESDVTSIFGEVVVDEFLGTPEQVDPGYAESVHDNYMEFTHDRASPDFWLIMLQTYPDQAPIWRYVLPGDQLSYTYPDLATLSGLPELPSGYSVWIVYGIEAPGFVYDEWSYRYLYQNYWSAYTADAFIFQFSE